MTVRRSRGIHTKLTFGDEMFIVDHHKPPNFEHPWGIKEIGRAILLTISMNGHCRTENRMAGVN